MCAAPGSKTAQLIEFLHADESITPTGKIVFFLIDLIWMLFSIIFILST